MNTGFLHTHTLVVTLYMIFILGLAVILLLGKEDLFDQIRAKAKIPRMVIETLMLVTGIYLISISAYRAEFWIWAKLGLVAASLGLGIVGMKRKRGGLLLASGLLLVYIFGVAETKSLSFRRAVADSKEKTKEIEEKMKVSGKPVDSSLAETMALYSLNCAQCHGEDGALGMSGAKDLRISELEEKEIQSMIRKGKGLMPGNPNLSDEQVLKLSQYAKTFRKTSATE